jgi:hypothetical protein
MSAPAAAERTVAPQPSPGRDRYRPAEAARIALLAAGAIAIAFGLLLRLWLLAHLPLFGDEAIVGLMARSIDSGHFSVFYWGQQYGGLEPYLAAIVLPVGGGGVPALNATPALLSAVAAALVGVITFGVGRNRLLAFGAACLAWVWPFAAVWGSVRELGVHSAALCCGLAAVACCARAYRGGAGRMTFVALGVLLGLGWWASPEILYFAPPCLVLLCAWWWNASHTEFVEVRSDRARPAPGTSLGLAVAGFFVGSLPWWYANAHSGFASLRPGVLPAGNGSTYGARLSVFFHGMLPLQLGVRTVLSGSWVGGPLVGQTLFALLVVLVGAAVARAVWLCARRPRELTPVALAAGVVAFPFLYAAAPSTGFWLDGRYGVYFPALLAALFGSVLAVPRRETSSDPRWVSARAATPGVLVTAALGVLGAAFLTAGAAHAAGVPSPSFFSGWQSPDSSMQQVVDAMRAHHIEDAYGDYWTAYDLDFVGHGQPVVSPSVLDVNRSAAIAAQVRSSKDPAWLFFAPGQAAAAAAAFSNPQPGPGPYTEASFEALLRQRGIAFKVVQLGVLDAIVPARRLTTP